MVSAPGQNLAMRRRAPSGTAVANPRACSSSATSTGSSTLRGRPLTRNSRSAAPECHGSAANPYTVSVGIPTMSPARRASTAAAITSAGGGSPPAASTAVMGAAGPRGPGPGRPSRGAPPRRRSPPPWPWRQQLRIGGGRSRARRRPPVAPTPGRRRGSLEPLRARLDRPRAPTFGSQSDTSASSPSISPDETYGGFETVRSTWPRRCSGSADHHRPDASRTRAAARPPSPARLAPATSSAAGEMSVAQTSDAGTLGRQSQGDRTRPCPQIDGNQTVGRPPFARGVARSPVGRTRPDRPRQPARSRAAG